MKLDDGNNEPKWMWTLLELTVSHIHYVLHYTKNLVYKYSLMNFTLYIVRVKYSY